MADETPKNMKLRHEILVAIKHVVDGWEASSQSEAAARLGITQPRASRLLSLDVDVYGVDKLVSIAEHIGLDVSMKVKKRRSGAVPIDAER